MDGWMDLTHSRRDSFELVTALALKNLIDGAVAKNNI